MSIASGSKVAFFDFDEMEMKTGVVIKVFDKTCTVKIDNEIDSYIFGYVENFIPVVDVEYV